MPSDAITVTPLVDAEGNVYPHDFGADIGGVDLANMSDRQVRAFNQAMVKHQVLRIPTAGLDNDGFVKFAKRLGMFKLDYQQKAGGAAEHPTHPEIFRVSNQDPTNNSETPHQDGHNDDKNQPDCSMLMVYEGRHKTRFYNGRQAYSQLSPELRVLLGRCTLYMQNCYMGGTNALRPMFNGIHPEGSIPTLSRPVFTLDSSGTPILDLVADRSPRWIPGLPGRTSDSVIAKLWEVQLGTYADIPWAEGDVMVWRNRELLHQGIKDDPAAVRELGRITLTLHKSALMTEAEIAKLLQ
ncbi:TauD/TfdA dioxygenase family protein [Rhizobium terrae]|uniref:TauD/TfdA dioxygenase family protein n=1 Tax=Rhizobium terrae TaxID=2171756 RepID=UPI000E3C96A4|nr:TauD/TfdA family dioxygenase [Rhizobium terrae]